MGFRSGSLWFSCAVKSHEHKINLTGSLIRSVCTGFKIVVYLHLIKRIKYNLGEHVVLFMTWPRCLLIKLKYIYSFPYFVHLLMNSTNDSVPNDGCVLPFHFGWRQTDTIYIWNIYVHTWLLPACSVDFYWKQTGLICRNNY